MLSINLTASPSQDATINGITIQRVTPDGGGNPIDQVWTNVDGSSVASPISLDTNNQVSFTFSSPLLIKAGTTTNIQVYMNLLKTNTTSGAQITFGLTSVNATDATITGLPITGSTFTVTDISASHNASDTGSGSTTSSGTIAQ